MLEIDQNEVFTEKPRGQPLMYNKLLISDDKSIIMFASDKIGVQSS